MVKFSEYFNKYNGPFNFYLDEFIRNVLPVKNSDMLDLFLYHLGLMDGQAEQGKRIRPMMVLLCAEGAGADWHSALPAATAVELIHNFSLVHDDIEDKGYLRRGKEAVWVKWGLPIALNAGDAMFVAGFKAMLDLAKFVDMSEFTRASDLFVNTCLHLTQGQHLDIGFEKKVTVEVEEYYRMIEGKTAALFGCCAQMGAIIGKQKQEECQKYFHFGQTLGITFQIYDDFLGIWGDPNVIGKSVESDLVEGKKTLPILIGLNTSQKFRDRWLEGPINSDETIEIVDTLNEDGVELLVRQELNSWHQRLINALEHINCGQSEKEALCELSNLIIARNK